MAYAGKDIRFIAELQAATRRYINRLVQIADDFGEDRDEVVFREIEALVITLEGKTFEAFDVAPDEFFGE